MMSFIQKNAETLFSMFIAQSHLHRSTSSFLGRNSLSRSLLSRVVSVKMWPGPEITAFLPRLPGTSNEFDGLKYGSRRGYPKNPW